MQGHSFGVDAQAPRLSEKAFPFQEGILSRLTTKLLESIPLGLAPKPLGPSEKAFLYGVDTQAPKGIPLGLTPKLLEGIFWALAFSRRHSFGVDAQGIPLRLTPKLLSLSEKAFL